jgi:hypothetical protein
MKNSVLCFLLLFTINVFCLDYGDKTNWAVCETNDAGQEQLFDVFYIYPTLVADKEKPLMDWSQPQIASKTVGFVRAQAGLWGKQTRVFAPYVRQLEFTRCLPDLKNVTPWENTQMKQGIDDTADAFTYYMKNFNKGRPFILLGHSQGAMDLYCLLTNNQEISARNGVVAAYLIGLPKVTEDRFSGDFAKRDISPAKGANDLGVVIVWNTQNAEAEESLFSGPGVLCINPLNWRTDSVKASAAENREAVFYDYKTGKTERKPAFCGAYIDLTKGALIVDLPSAGIYDGNGMMGKGVFHGNDIWFFSENLRLNAVLRVEAWLKEQNKK